MKKLFVLLSIVAFIGLAKPLISWASNGSSTLPLVKIEQVEVSPNDSFINQALDGIQQFYQYTGFANATAGHLIMIFIGIIFI